MHLAQIGLSARTIARTRRHFKIKSVRLALALLPCIAAPEVFSSKASAADHRPQVGDTTQIMMVHERNQQRNGASSGSSFGRDTIIERVIAVSNAGVTLEFDLPDQVSSEDRARVWQYPFRVLKTTSGTIQLLNRAELEVRVNKWLKAANLPREVCGHWFFTWNAFHIECEPETVLKTVEVFDLSQNVGEGTTYHDKDARTSGTIRRTTDASGVTKFAVDLEVDPEAVRRARVETDLVVGEIMHKPVTLDSARRERAKEVISGTITITFETGEDGQVRRRTKVMKVQTKFPDGHLETETMTQTLERRRVAVTRSASAI